MTWWRKSQDAVQADALSSNDLSSAADGQGAHKAKYNDLLRQTHRQLLKCYEPLMGRFLLPLANLRGDAQLKATSDPQ